MTKKRSRIDAAGLVLHDTPIVSAEFVDDTLVFVVELCAWMQPGFTEGEEELVPGRIVYEKVRDLRLDPAQQEVMSPAWWKGRGGKFLTSDVAAGNGLARLIFEAGAADGTSQRTFIADFRFARALFSPT